MQQTPKSGIYLLDLSLSPTYEYTVISLLLKSGNAGPMALQAKYGASIEKKPEMNPLCKKRNPNKKRHD